MSALNGLLIEPGSPEAEILISCLRTGHTWTLDALGVCITQGDVQQAAKCIVQHRRMVEMCRAIGYELGYEWRMEALREHARRKGNFDMTVFDR